MKRENDLIFFGLVFFAIKEKTNRREGRRETTRGNDSYAPPPHSHELNASKNERCVALVVAALDDVRPSVHHLFLPWCPCLTGPVVGYSLIDSRVNRYQYVYSFRHAHFINTICAQGTQFERIQLQFLQFQQEGLRGGSLPAAGESDHAGAGGGK